MFKRHATPFFVHYRMTDQMGVVYYANYLELFEIGRASLIRDGGLKYQQMETDGFMLPVVRAEVDYLLPARYEDALLIHTWISRLTRVRVEFEYEITRGDSADVICRGLTRHIIAGHDGKPRRLSPDWMRKLEALR